jgi:predicted ATP-binding protein involved in virulence
MAKYIDRISGTIPHTNKTVDIPVNGNNLIITGGNGSGKSSFLKSAYENVSSLVGRNIATDISDRKNKIITYITHQDIFINNYSTNMTVVQYFEDNRLVYFTEPNDRMVMYSPTPTEEEMKNGGKLGHNLEIFLAKLKIDKSLAITEEKNKDLSEKIDSWLNHFENSLRELLEDNTTQLIFDMRKKTFTIKQKSKPEFNFRTLSTGYKALFDIYADLLMRTEYFEISPTELEGVVFIDEIDSHLHISLQRLILPFLTESFPEIQFIVTTHSPFVLQSVKGAIVFDLGKDESSVVTEVNSVNKVLSQYLNVPVAMPLWAENKLNEILNKYLTKNADDISLAEMDKELESAGLSAYMPHAVSKVLEAN